MTAAALALVLASAFLHSGWNLIAKRSSANIPFVWVACLGGLFLYAPVFAVVVANNPIPPRGWIFVGASAAIHAAYFLLLGGAYARSDLSIVYPLARGTGPLFVVILAMVFLKEAPTAAGLAGVLLVIAGVYALHAGALLRASPAKTLRTLSSAGSRLALLTGVTIGLYSTVDKAGVVLVQPLAYVYLQVAGAALLMGPAMLRRTGPIVAVIRREVWWALAAGALLFGAYALVLTAMTSSKVSYVAAARETSILIAAAYGGLILKEKLRPPRLAGAALLALGVTLIVAGG